MNEAIIFSITSPKKYTIGELAYVNTKTGESMCYFNIKKTHCINITDCLAVGTNVIFLIKGADNRKLLTQLTGRKFINLQNYGCPDFNILPFPRIFCGEEYSHNCSLKIAKAYAIWYNE